MYFLFQVSFQIAVDTFITWAKQLTFCFFETYCLKNFRIELDLLEIQVALLLLSGEF